MNSIPNKAAFFLESFYFKNFSFEHPERDVQNLDIEFIPHGSFIENKGFFYLTVIFWSGERNSENEKTSNILNVTFVSKFVFVDKINFKEIPEYFYQNSLAIIYPYVRAFVSTMTLQANTKLLILPILNLTTLEGIFKTNTSVKNEEE